MKNRTVTLALVAGLLIAGSRSQSQSLEGTAAWVYDFGHKESSAVTTKKIGEVHNLFGKGFSLDVDLFAGANFDRKAKPITGILVGKRSPLADEVTGYFGAGLAFQDSARPSPCIGAGFTWRF